MSKQVEYMCTWCGKKVVKPVNGGRPLPGSCPKNKSGRHVWTQNRTIG